jgi:hypothetical protein
MFEDLITKQIEIYKKDVFSKEDVSLIFGVNIVDKNISKSKLINLLQKNNSINK